jgi:hypothetical protein
LYWIGSVSSFLLARRNLNTVYPVTGLKELILIWSVCLNSCLTTTSTHHGNALQDKIVLPPTSSLHSRLRPRPRRPRAQTPPQPSRCCQVHAKPDDQKPAALPPKSRRPLLLQFSSAKNKVQGILVRNFSENSVRLVLPPYCQ